jgi:hypothetical protein
MCRQNATRGFDPEGLYGFAMTYPRYATTDRHDIWFLYPTSGGSEIPSLCTLVVPGSFEGLTKMHARMLMDPMALPRFPPPPEVAVIETFTERGPLWNNFSRREFGTKGRC